MEDKEQKIKLEFETNADQTAKKIDGLTQSTEATVNAQTKAKSSSSDLAKNLQGLDTPINGTIKGFGGMVKAMWAIVANPLGAILAAIAVALFALFQIFKSFQPLVDKVEQSVAALGAAFNVVKNTFLAVFTGTKNLGEAMSGLGGDMADAADRAAALTKAQQDLDDVMKSQEVTTARNRAEINKLNVELRNRTKTDEERLKLADEIVKKEQSDYEQRKKIVDEEVRIAREAIAIKAQFTKAEIKQLKETGDATKELAESRGGNYDEEYDALNKARIKAISLEDEVTVNIEKAYNRRDKLEDDAQAKRDKAAAELKAREEKARKAREEAEKKRLELIKTGIDAETAARRSLEDLNDKTEEEKLQRQKDRSLEEIEALRKRGIDVENLLKYNEEKFFTLEQELAAKRLEEKKVANQKLFDQESEAKNKQIEADLEASKKLAEEEVKIEKAKQQQKEEIQNKSLELAEKSVGLLSNIFGKNKKIQKAAMIAEGAISIGKQIAANNAANIGALATPQAILTSGASAVPIIALNNVSTGIGVASTIASTAKALQSLGGGSVSGGSPSKVSGSAASTSPQVSFQASNENQIGNALANKVNDSQVIEAFITESSVTTAQSLANNRITSNSL